MFEAHDKLRKMRETVHDELKHIPRGGLEQNLFRALFESARMNSLGKQAQRPNSKKAVLKACLDHYKKTDPNFEPQYERDFFHEKKR